MIETKEITEQEYYDWLRKSKVVENESCVFSSMIGVHEYATGICYNGVFYQISWGESLTERNEKGNRKICYWIREYYDYEKTPELLKKDDRQKELRF